jgi:hypothetical protein
MTYVYLHLCFPRYVTSFDWHLVTSVTSEQPFEEPCSEESVSLETSRRNTPVSTHSVEDWEVKENVRFQVLPFCIKTIAIHFASHCGSEHRQILSVVRHCLDLAAFLVFWFCFLLIMRLIQWGSVCLSCPWTNCLLLFNTYFGTEFNWSVSNKDVRGTLANDTTQATELLSA